MAGSASLAPMMQVLISMMLLACTPSGVDETTVSSTPVVREAPAIRGDWNAELQRLDSTIAATAERAGDQWMVLAELAGHHQMRARLTGDLDDYARAEDALAKGFSHAPEGAGPHLGRASLHFSLHRLDAVEPDLVMAERRVNPDKSLLARIRLMRARLDVERGNYADAAAGYQEALSLDDTLQVHVAIAHHAWHTADWATAEAELDVAEGMYHGTWGEPRAWFHLLRGLMDLDRERYDEALAHYRDADFALADYWLVQEHIAEVLSLQGKYDKALALYTPAVERTGSPELMGAMAGTLAEMGRVQEAEDLIARATAGFEANLARFPEAAYGHALEHFLEHGTPEQALSLAEKNAALRPNGPALELLSEAYARAGRPEDAAAAAARARATGWVPPAGT